MKSDEVLIIGAGPAGMAAAIQLKRYGIPFVLLEKEQVGGLLWNANLVENYPGFPAGVSGPRLVQLIEKQLKRLSVEVTFDSVEQLRYNEDSFHVKTRKTEYHPRYVIVASGTKPTPIPLLVNGTFQGRVLSEVYPLLAISDQKIIIVGAGDAAFDYALNLTKNRNSVTILNRGIDVKCLGLLWERARADPGIAYCAETAVSTVELDQTGCSLTVRTEAGQPLEADYLLFATGRIPQTGFLPDEILNNNLEGIFYAGDVKNGRFRQAAIAAGDGLRAAMEIYHNLTLEALSQ